MMTNKKISRSLRLLLFFTSLGCLASSCQKDRSKCETWEFQDVCTPKVSSANCYEYANRVANICNAELDDAHDGRTSIIKEDKNVRIERHYVRQVN